MCHVCNLYWSIVVLYVVTHVTSILYFDWVGP